MEDNHLCLVFGKVKTRKYTNLSPKAFPSPANAFISMLFTILASHHTTCTMCKLIFDIKHLVKIISLKISSIDFLKST